MADIAADGVPPFSPTGARQKHLGEHTTSIHDSGVRAGARMRPRERPRRRPASELLRLIEVLVLNEVVEEGGAGRPASLLGPLVVSPPLPSRTRATHVLVQLNGRASARERGMVVGCGTTRAFAPVSCFSPHHNTISTFL